MMINHETNYKPHIIRWRFCVQIFSPDGVAISKSRDVASCSDGYKYNVDFWFKNQEVHDEPPESKIDDLPFDLEVDA